MKKIVSNILIVSAQLLVGGLFLLTLFSNNDADNSVVVVRNNNLDKMADSVSGLFVDSLAQTVVVDDTTEEEIRTEEEIAAEKAKIEAEEKAKAEAEAKAQKEKKRQEEEQRAQEEAKQSADASKSVSYSNDVVSLQSYAHDLVINSYGWSENDFNALVSLWNKESGWNVHAGNSRSGAYGIPQALPASKMSDFGDDYIDNGQTQIKWGLSYIKNTYGSPSNAWQHFLNVGWY